jgi:hypothetical protein
MCSGSDLMQLIRVLAVACCLAFALLAPDGGFAADGGGRVALVIGNSKYPDSDVTLQDVANDTQDIAGELRQDGFGVETGMNLTGDATRKALDRFYGKITQDSVALIFFAGFGIQSARQTYLIPVDAQIWTEPDVRRDGFDLETILAEMSRRGALVKIALLDASRRNPFERRFRQYSAGLAPVITPSNTMAMYATAPGAVINQAEGDHGLFVRELLREIRVPGNGAEQALTNTRAGVTRASRGEQAPWLSSSLVDNFSFVPGKDPRPPDKPEKEKKSDPACERPQPPVPPNPDELAKDPRVVELTRRIARDRNDQVAYYRRGRVYATKGAYALAAKDFDDAIRINPKDFETYNNRCWTRAVLGDLQAALSDCNEALRLNPRYAEALDSRGLANLKLGRSSDAISDFDAALEANSRSASSLFGRGIAQLRSGGDGAFDLSLAKSLDANIAKEFAGYGIFECGG